MTPRGPQVELARRRPPWAPLGGLLLGLLLLTMATPRLLSGLKIEGYDRLFRDLAAGRPVGGETLVRAAADFEAALGWIEEANERADLATLNYAIARELGFSSDSGRLYLERSRDNNRLALAGNPAQPYGWVQLAIAEEALSGASARSVAALFASFARAPLQPRLAVLRTGLGLRNWTLLDATQRSRIADEALVAAASDPRALARAVPSPALWGILQDLLLPRPELLQAVAVERR